MTSYFVGGGKPKIITGQPLSSRKRQRPFSGGSFRSRNGGSGFGQCPLCQMSFAWHVLESHASECTGMSNSDRNSSSSSCNGIGMTATAVGDNITRRDDKSHGKASIPRTPLKSNDATEIIATPLENIHKQTFPKTPIAKTEAAAAAAAAATTLVTTSNIVTPRLAPIFQAKTKDRNSNDETLNNKQKEHLELRPHSYEPIPGLFVYEDFITEEEEAFVVKGCVNVGRDAIPAWKQCRFNGKHVGKRWGVHCNLRDRRVDSPEHPLPDVLSKIIFPKIKRLNLPATQNFCPNEANAIDYRRKEGHWLKAHVDDRKLSKEAILNLSLVGDCYMTFRNVSKHRNLAVSEQRVLLKRRCLQVLTGKARYDFSHGIANVDLLSDRRVSVTMRESPLTTSKTIQNKTTTTATGS